MNLTALVNAVTAEANLLDESLRLAANETLMSQTPRHLARSPLASTYYMGAGDEDQIIDFQPFTFVGRPTIAALEAAACDAAADMLKAESVRLGCLTGVHAMMSMILSLTEPGWTVATLSLDHGGHFATPMIVEAAGRRHEWVTLTDTLSEFDMETLAERLENPSRTLIYLDVSMNRTDHDLTVFRNILGDEPTLLYDASHTLGLMMGGAFTNPLTAGFDVVSGNSHKTLPGPHKAVVAFGNEATRVRTETRLNAGLTSTVQPGALMALAITVLEMAEHGVAYANQVIANANALGTAMESSGCTVRRLPNGAITENHQIHVELPEDADYRSTHLRLATNQIVANIDGAFGSPYIRIGSQYITRMGMTNDDMTTVGSILTRALLGDGVIEEVRKLIAEFPNVVYSFDNLNLGRLVQ